MCLKIKKPYMREIQIHGLYSKSTFTQSSSRASVHIWTCLRSQHFQKYTQTTVMCIDIVWLKVPVYLLACISQNKKNQYNKHELFFFSVLESIRIGGEVDDRINKKSSLQCSQYPILNMSKLLMLMVTKHTFVHF